MYLFTGNADDSTGANHGVVDGAGQPTVAVYFFL
jgi:hypothetical protein